jgi:hypothetical protein
MSLWNLESHKSRFNEDYHIRAGGVGHISFLPNKLQSKEIF